jgi:hypothetical protein
VPSAEEDAAAAARGEEVETRWYRMERFHAIQKHEASRRFGKRGHDCLNPHDSHCAATPTTSTLRYVGRSTGASHAAASHESRVATRPHVKPNSRFEYQDAKFQKTAREKRCWPHHGFATSPKVGPGPLSVL